MKLCIKNVNENRFSFTFLCNISCNGYFAIFVRTFMKFSPRSRTKKLGIIYTILESFYSFLNMEGADLLPPIFGPKSGLGKSLC